MKPSRLAVDTNVLLDIADEADDVLDAADVIADRLPDAEQLVTPSVLEELAFLADSGLTRQVRQSARKAIQLLRDQDRFRPILELPFAPEKVGETGRRISPPPIAAGGGGSRFPDFGGNRFPGLRHPADQ